VAGWATAWLRVARVLYDRVIDGDISAIRWYEVTRCGRSERLRGGQLGKHYPSIPQVHPSLRSGGSSD
jgi:hypothetical protein